MENLGQTLLPILQSNTVTIGLGLQTASEAFYRGVAEKNYGMLALDVVAAGLLGIAASAGLPEIGIQATPEIITYAAAIGFNLPTFVSWALGNERFWSTSLPMGIAGAGIGAFTDAMQVPVNVNSLAKTVLHNLAHFGNMR